MMFNQRETLIVIQPVMPQGINLSYCISQDCYSDQIGGIELEHHIQ